MCGHIYIGYHEHQQLRQPRALWRCSACGRQSHMPLDCCTHPDYNHSAQPGIVHASVQWLAEAVSRVQTSLQSWLWHRQKPVLDDLNSAHETEQPKPLFMDTDFESLNALLSDIDTVSEPDELTEETRNRVGELQLR
jgi:hypothetical protein